MKKAPKCTFYFLSLPAELLQSHILRTCSSLSGLTWVSEPISSLNLPSLCWMHFGLILVMLFQGIYANFLPGKHCVPHFLDLGQHQQPRMGKPLFQHLLRQELCRKLFTISTFIILLICMVSLASSVGWPHSAASVQFHSKKRAVKHIRNKKPLVPMLFSLFPLKDCQWC